MDHPSIALASFLKPQARVTNEETLRHLFLALRYSSNIGGAPPGDMFVVGANKTSWHAVGEQIMSFIVFVNKTFSETDRFCSTHRAGVMSPRWNSTLLVRSTRFGAYCRRDPPFVTFIFGSRYAGDDDGPVPAATR